MDAARPLAVHLAEDVARVPGLVRAPSPRRPIWSPTVPAAVALSADTPASKTARTAVEASGRVLRSAFRTPRRSAAALAVGVALTAVLLWAFWPAGVLAGALLGVVAVLGIGRRMTEAADAEPLDPELATALGIVDAEPEPAEAHRLRASLGDDLPDFARAARLVVRTQYASAARLQRDLQVPWSRARRLLDDLEHEQLVGPAVGTRPRRVLLPAERLADLERMLAEV